MSADNELSNPILARMCTKPVQMIYMANPKRYYTNYKGVWIPELIRVTWNPEDSTSFLTLIELLFYGSAIAYGVAEKTISFFLLNKEDRLTVLGKLSMLDKVTQDRTDLDRFGACVGVICDWETYYLPESED